MIQNITAAAEELIFLLANKPSTSRSSQLNIKTNNSLKELSIVAALKPPLGKVDTSLPHKRISLFFCALISKQG